MADLNNVQQLPLVGGLAFQTFDTVLSNTAFTVNVRWNASDDNRVGAWRMDLLDADGSRIFSGIKIVLGIALGRRCTDPRMPPGVFWAVDLAAAQAGTKRDATLDDLGTRVVVYYYPFDEWFAAPGEAAT